MTFVENLTTAGWFFIQIALELTILFIVITFIVGMIQEYLPAERIKKSLEGRSKVAGSMLGAGFGALTPFCSCSTIPLLLGMLEVGIPFGICMSFLIASPILNPIIVSLFAVLLGWKITAIYVILTFIAAVVLGMIFKRLGFEDQIKSVAVVGGGGDLQVDMDVKSRINRSAGFAWTLFKQLIPYLLIGAGIGAFIHGFVPEGFFAGFAGADNPFVVPIAAVIGVPMYIRAETLIPIGFALIEKGLSIGAVMALVIGGAGASIPEVALLSAMFKKKLLAVYIITIFGIAVVVGYVFNLLVTML
ncbi:MAG: permease [Candidatus Thermoplasmatota archaeon]|nr:permease [Candidatus Thermoplasmatota archaeon]